MSEKAPDFIQRWTEEPANSARSVLVTVFGDTILPVTRSLWLAQIFPLADAFGYSARLVRTSMFRLASEGWFTTERVGRQSRYTLTPLAIAESGQAAERIYASANPDWAGPWTAVFLSAPGIDQNTRERLRTHLQWQGFVQLGDHLLAAPATSVEQARELCHLIAPQARPPLAALEFTDLDAVVADGFFSNAVGLEALQNGYRHFVDAYSPLGASPECTALQAFALRTMLVHDLRRIRLRSADVPAALLPPDWVGNDASELASKLYGHLSALAAPVLSDILEIDYPGRFPNRLTHSR